MLEPITLINTSTVKFIIFAKKSTAANKVRDWFYFKFTIYSKLQVTPNISPQKNIMYNFSYWKLQRWRQFRSKQKRQKAEYIFKLKKSEIIINPIFSYSSSLPASLSISSIIALGPGALLSLIFPNAGLTYCLFPESLPNQFLYFLSRQAYDFRMT